MADVGAQEGEAASIHWACLVFAVVEAVGGLGPLPCPVLGMDALCVLLGNPAKETLPLNGSLRRWFHFIAEVGTERPGQR